MNRVPKLLRNPHFWIISAIFLICVFLHYPQQFLGGIGLSSLLGLSRYTVERVLFLFPVTYAGFVFGVRGGVVSLVASLFAMLPRAIFVSPHPVDALLETVAITVAGGLANWWLEAHRRETGRREQGLLQLEAVRRELESYIETIKAAESRLAALNDICRVVNQSLVLEEVLSAAGDKTGNVMDVETVLIFLLDEEAGELQLRFHRGVSEEFVAGVERMKLGEGFNGWVAETGEPLWVEDCSLDPRLSREVVRREGISSQFIVPLKSRDRVVGTLCVAARSLRQFTSDERELLALVGSEIGIAIEKAYLYQESQLARRRFQELFEKAHDAIWVQDMEGKIIAANKAGTTLTGYGLDEIIGKNVTEFLTAEALELAREIRRKLLSGEGVKQPYEQRIIKRDGTEAILMLTTSLIGDEETPRAFQHISRDITEERQLQESLRHYVHQITKASEEERGRIARELHDETAQALVVLSRRLDNFISRNNVIPEEVAKFLEDVQKEMDNILQGLRRFSQDLRPPTLDYLGVTPAVRELVSTLEKQCAIDANLKVTGTELRFNQEAELLIYRIVQEALRNIWKHSEATKVDVSLEFGPEKIRVTVSDNGKGFECPTSLDDLASRGKLGLVGMQERARLLGGTLTVHSELAKGTTIILDSPALE